MATSELSLVAEEGKRNEDEFEVGGDLDENGEKPPPFVLTEDDEDSENLVELFQSHPEGVEALKRLARQAINDFDTAWESTEEYRARMAEDWKLFAAKLPLKSKPFKDAADVHVPSYLENATRIIFRAFNEVYGNWDSIFTVQKSGPTDNVADLLTRYDNYQLTCEIKDFYRQQMRAMLQYFTVGDVVGHSFYDGFREQNRHEVLTCDDFTAPYMHLTTQPDYSDLPYRVKILNLYRHELQAMDGRWVGVKRVLKREKPDIDDEPESLWATAMADVHKIERPTDQRTSPFKVLWYEGWTDEIPNQDRDRFVQVIVDYHTRVVLSLTIHEEPGYKEKLRYEQESAEHAQYSEARQAFQQAQAAAKARRAELELQMQDPMAQMAPPEVMAQMQAEHAASDPEAMQHPMPPTWMMQQQEEGAEPDIYPDPDAIGNQPRPPRKDPIHTFVHAVCIEPMVGNLGIGYGRIQADFNKALNIILSQSIDSATLANASGMIVSGNVEFKRPFTHGPGVVNIAEGVSGQNLKDNIMPLQLGPANPQMFEIWDRIYNFAQSSAQSPEVLGGEPGKSGETFRGLNARIEQATTQLSVPTRTFALTYLEPTLKNNAKLNSMFLPEEHVCYLPDELGNPMEVRVGRRMYERDYRVKFSGDLRYAGRQQKIAEADEVVAMANMKGGPMAPGPLNPTGNLAFMHRAMALALRARGKADMIPFLGPPPPPPATPFGMMPPAPPVVQPPGAPPGAAPPPPGGPAGPGGAAAKPPQGPPPQGAPAPQPPSPSGPPR